MQFLNRLREGQVRRIEAAVVEINQQIDALDPWDDYSEVASLEERRRKLWLRRSDIVKKLPPTYQEVQ